MFRKFKMSLQELQANYLQRGVCVCVPIKIAAVNWWRLQLLSAAILSFKVPGQPSSAQT